ncbi:MAG TPA: ABC transporter ATP-binding protein [Actinomycetes bacterium]|nr:ABC transporter ATP-binding protein [Actinomycetes bacterium]
MLVIKDLRRTFGDVVALDGVSLDVARNEFFAILGPSGCGKTTLLRILAGFEHPDAGSVELEGSNLLGLAPNRRPVNLMFQSYALFPHMSVERNVAYGLEREGLPKSEVRKRVADVLRTVDLTELANRRPRQLSGGQRQRVALARAIVKRPKMLLLDEPLSALDKKVRAEMQRELKRLQHEVGITFAVVTHDQEEAMSMADRIAVMHQGTVQQVADPVSLYRNPANVFVADFIGDSNLLAGTRTTNGVAVTGLGDLPGRGAVAEGSPATLMIRPEDVKLSDAGSLRGTVTDVQFYGGTSTLAIDVGHGLPPVLSAVSGTSPAAPGAQVTLTWAPDDAVILHGETSPPTVPPTIHEENQ